MTVNGDNIICVSTISIEEAIVREIRESGAEGA